MNFDTAISWPEAFMTVALLLGFMGGMAVLVHGWPEWRRRK